MDILNEAQKVADILARRKEEQRMTALRLDRLGWTQEEIGNCIGVSRDVTRTLLGKISELKKSPKNLLDEGHPHLDVAERYNMPLQLVWAIDLHGRTDAQRMDRLGIKVQPYDVWNFGKCHDLFGAEHPGRIPGQLVAHVVYFYTKPGVILSTPAKYNLIEDDAKLMEYTPVEPAYPCEKCGGRVVNAICEECGGYDNA